MSQEEKQHRECADVSEKDEISRNSFLVRMMLFASIVLLASSALTIAHTLGYKRGLRTGSSLYAGTPVRASIECFQSIGVCGYKSIEKGHAGPLEISIKFVD